MISKEEYEKAKSDFEYFYNHYITYDGKQPLIEAQKAFWKTMEDAKRAGSKVIQVFRKCYELRSDQ